MNFVKDLKVILMDCEYDNTDDILVDCIIDGVADSKLQEKLLDRGGDLSLSKAIEIGQQYHESKTQLKLLREEAHVYKVDAIKKRHQPQPKPKRKPEQYHQTNRFSHKQCTRCGKSDAHKFCPAKTSVCGYCKKKGHWQAVCRNRTQAKVHTVSQVEGEEFEEEEIAIYAFSSSNNNDKWKEKLKVNNNNLQFRIDTGAKCNIILKEDFQMINNPGTLYKSNTILRSYSNHVIKPVGQIELTVQSQTSTVEAKFQVVDIKAENIISGDLAEELGLISKVEALQHEIKSSELDDYPEVTNTTGLLPGLYKIKLEEGSKGVIHACRKFPPALKEKINAKLLEMEHEQFIAKVNEPTEWVNSMVVSTRNDKVRICLDRKDLNKAIKREHHPVRSIEEIAREIPNAKVFSKLDAKSGFMQIQLDEESSKLTTFNTPLGRYRWLRLPFGLKCSPEIFQRIMDQMLEGTEGAFSIIDDILIAGKDRKHHDQILKKVLKRATDYNLKLNLEKVRIRQTSVVYCGHVISTDGLKADPEKIKAVHEMPRPCNKEALRRFLGFITYLGKFIPNLSQENEPLRQLLKAENQFQWEDQHEKAFKTLKNLCTEAPVLKLFNVKNQLKYTAMQALLD